MYKELTSKNPTEFQKWVERMWDTYNSPNLKYNIKPFCYRSNLIIHKTVNHQINWLKFKM